ncbi:MAG: hypothetical protein ACJ8BW_14230 [Ktedonobacteraceae bacterium]
MQNHLPKSGDYNKDMYRNSCNRQVPHSALRFKRLRSRHACVIFSPRNRPRATRRHQIVTDKPYALLSDGAAIGEALARLPVTCDLGAHQTNSLREG